MIFHAVVSGKEDSTCSTVVMSVSHSVLNNRPTLLLLEESHT